MAESNRRQQEERSKLADGIRIELDDTLPPDTLLDAAVVAARPPPALQTSSTSGAGQLEALSPTSVGAVSPGSVSSERSYYSSNGAVLPLRRPSESTVSTVSDGDVARELHATGFPATQKEQSAANNISAGSTDNKSSEQELLELNDDTIANADGILDEDDVTFVSSDDESDDEEEKEAESSRRSSRRSSASQKVSKAATRAEREEKEQERERDEREKRAKETEMERQERERREQEDREKKEREWQELKERLMNEARELQEAERQRLQKEREEEGRRVAASMAAKEAEMNELLAKLKEVEVKGVPPLPTLPDAQPIIGTTEPAVSSAPIADTQATAAGSAARSVTTPEQSSSDSATATKSLPPLSSITLRSASESLARRTAAEDDVIDEPKQAPGAQNALPSLSSTPVRRLVAASTTAASTTSPPKKAKAKSEASESMAISSMLHELEQLEEEEEMMLRMGLEVRKVPRMGKSKVVKMYIDKNEADEWVVRWDSKKKKKEEASLTLNGCRVVSGMQAGLFLKAENAERFSAQRNCCFSVITADRTLDVVAMTFSDQDLWTRTLVRLSKQRKRGTAINSPNAASTPVDSAAGSRVVSPINSAPASRRGSGNVGGFVSVGMERSKNKQSGGAEMSVTDPSKEIENYLSRHLKNF